MTITEDYFAVQFGAFRTKVYAEIMKNKVEGALDKNVELFEEDGFWKVRITGFDDRERP
ncbi:MAG: SPOR domain-containing protein [Marinilabiliales bacterium]|nr:SPOR domain-containing protein [Marinilabiliales bacterium]